jgi:hexosaminidase
VVLAHATHLYFDHPEEPDPEERGYYWATRYTDTMKTFMYYPDDIYENIQTDR